MENRVLSHLGMALPLAIATIVGFTDNNPIFAQLTPDNTLGAESSVVIQQQLQDLIQGGAIRGNSLFHSFSEFNVEDGGSVFFDLQNNGNILNILTRVTGSSSSQILGTLGVLNDLGNANLFLLNPNGITFGANANLQLNGSFFATTADGFGFDNFTFSASGEEAPPPLLTVSIPPFLSFRDNPGDIAVNQSNLSVSQGQNLTLVGGNITVEGGQLNAQGGRIELEGMFVAGNVTINEDFSLTFPEAVAPSDFDFELAETNATDTGKVTINADTLTLSNGVQIVSQTQDGRELGGITINATDSVNVTSGSQIRTQTNGTGSAEGITINSPNILLDGLLNNNIRSSLLVGASSSTSSSSNAGNLELNANIFNISDGGQIQTVSFGAGNVGNLNVNATEAVNFTNDGRLITQIRRGGSVGNVTINSPSITIDEASRILFQAGTFDPNNVEENRQATGNIGNLQIDTQNLTISNGGRITARTYSPGSIGNVIIDTDQVSITGSSTFGNGDSGSRITLQVGSGTVNFLVGNSDSPVNVNTTGSIGRLQINTRTLNLGDSNSQSDVTTTDQRSRIQVLTFGLGSVGDNIVDNDGKSRFVSININATESVAFNARSFVFNQTRAGGEAADIIINTPDFSLNENSLVFSRTGSSLFRFSSSQERNSVIAADNEFTTGNAGDIILNVGTLSLTHNNPVFSSRDGSKIQSQTFGAGTAGDIIINATESVSVSSDFTDLGSNRRSLIFSDFVSQVETENRAAGSIIINTPSLSLDNKSQITANTRGIGNSGNININASRVFLGNESAISSSSGFDFRTQLAGDGNTGSITIQADESISLNGNSLINTSVTDNATGNGGNITLTVPDLNILDGSLVRASTSSQQNSSSNAGSIDINVSGNVTIDGEGSSIRANTSAILGNGDVVGNINLSATNLTITDGGSIQALTFGSGDAGNIKINVTETIDLDGIDSGIFSGVSEGASGNGGFINIDPEQVTISNGATISASNQGIGGDAGQIFITSDNLTLRNNGLISAQDDSGAGGFIDLRIEDFIILNNSTISAAGTEAGSLNLQSTALVMFDNSLITVDSDNLAPFANFDVEAVLVSPDSTISVGGDTININTQVFVTPTAELETIEPDQQITQSACYDFGGDSQLANSGRGGIPQIPGLVVRNSVINVDLVDEVLLPPPPPEAIKPNHRTTVTLLNSEGEEFKPAMGAVLLPNGMVEFVDYSPAEVYRDMYQDMYAAGCLSRE